MKAVTWHGRRDVRVETVPDPKIEKPTDAIIEVTSTNICGSDLHLYEVLGAFMNEGDILGHEPMGIVREVGAEAGDLAVGDRVVIPFQISCGSCYMCDQQLYTQCETTQVRDQGMGAALFGYSELYGSGARRPGGVAARPAGPVHPHQGPRRARRTRGSSTCPTCCRRHGRPSPTPTSRRAASVTVLGLGPIGDMAAGSPATRATDVIAVDLVPERLARAHGARGARRSTSTSTATSRRRRSAT